ncbi:MAG: methyltransferase domain-containing protein [Oligoflexia bacterium]|nr:methyltransferase domain-containing protein [Oligoflexia bacterium]
MIKDNLVFLREFITEFKSTGTFFPSSKWAAKALAKPVLAKEREPLNILEAGPGSGPVTVHILKHMDDRDSLTVCEINPRFMKALKEKLSKNADYQRHKERVTFFEGAVQDLPEERTFDAIICAIPFLNLERPMVEEIFEKLRRLSNDKTLMTYFEYIGLRNIGLLASLPERKRRIQELDLFLKKMLNEHRIARERVWLNVLPIDIYTLQLAA